MHFVIADAVLAPDRRCSRRIGRDLPGLWVGREQQRDAIVLQQPQEIENGGHRLTRFRVHLRSVIQRPEIPVLVADERISLQCRRNTATDSLDAASQPLEHQQFRQRARHLIA